jgi:hypothetical protein
MGALAGAVFGPGNTTSKADSCFGSFISFLDIVEVTIYFSIPARTSTGSRTRQACHARQRRRQDYYTSNKSVHE